MFSPVPSEWEENFQDLSGWCSPTTSMIKQQDIADPAELNTPVIELGCEELQLNINVSKAESNYAQDTEEMIGVWSSLDEPSFVNMWLPKSNSPLIGVESVDPLGSEDFERKHTSEDKAKSFMEPSGLVSLANWECNSTNSNTLTPEFKTNISVDNKTTEVLKPKPKLKLNIPGNSQINNELSTPNIVKMLVESPIMITKKTTSVLPIELNPLDGTDDLLQPLVEQSGGFDLLAYMFEDSPKHLLSTVSIETDDKAAIKEENVNISEVCLKPALVQRPRGKTKSIGWKPNDIEKPCSSKQNRSTHKPGSPQFSVPLCSQIKQEDSTDEDEIFSKAQLRKQKSRKRTAPKPFEMPSKRTRRSTSSSSCLSETPLDVKYRELRDRNNEASKRSRYNRKIRDGEMTREALRLEKENHSLKIKAEEMERLVKQLRESLLKTIANRN